MATQAIPQAQVTRGFGVSLNILDWRIRTKLLVLFLVFSLLPAGALGAVNYPVFRNVIVDQATSALYGHAISTAAALDQYLADKREDIVAASQLPEFAVYLADPNDEAIKQNGTRELKALANRADYESMAVVGSNGKVLLSSADADVNTDLSFRPYFIEAMKGSAYISDPSVSVVTGRPAIFFSAPIKDANNKVVGVIRSRLSLNGIWGLVERDKEVAGPGSYGTLLDENGIRIANSQSLGKRDQLEGSKLLYTAVAPVAPEVEKALVAEKRFGKATSEKLQIVPVPEIADALATAGVKTFETSSESNSQRNLAALANVTNKPWRYVTMSPFSSFFGVMDNLTMIFALGMVLLVGLIIVAASFVARSFTTPLAKLTEAADRISLGELDTKIDISRKDEVGELAEAVSRMQASLQAAIERLRARRTNQ